MEGWHNEMRSVVASESSETTSQPVRQVDVFDPLAATPAALHALRRLVAERGPLLLFQSGGCCDGSLPICFDAGEFRIGAHDVCLGELVGCPFYIDHRQYEAWKHTQLILDVAPGEPEGFSLAAGPDAHFVTRTRVLSAPSNAAGLRCPGTGGGAIMSREPQQRFAVNGVELAWDEWGTEHAGPPLVLCHGFSGSSYDFSLEIDALATDRRVVVVDHRGHGLSTKTHDLASYSVGQLTADFVTFLDELVGGPIDLLGHSMGGRIALGALLDQPHLIRSLVLMDTSAWSFQPVDPELLAMMQGFIASFDPARGLPDPSLYRGPEDDLIEAATPEDWQARRRELMSDFDPYAFKALGTELFNSASLSVRGRLREISCPVTVLVGELDHPFIDQAPDLAAAVEGGVVVIDGAYHSPQLTHQERWLEAVNGHLAQVAARTTR